MNTVTKLCPNEKLLSRVPQTTVIRMLDAVESCLRQAHKYVRKQEKSTNIRPERWLRILAVCRETAKQRPVRLQHENLLPDGVQVPLDDTLCSGTKLQSLADALEAAV